MLYPQQPGTYCFHNTVNNKIYVGSAQCLYTRLTQHLNNQNSNKLLQRAIKKYGLKAYNITYIIAKTHTEALMQEQLMLDYLFKNNIPKYNISPNATGGKTLLDYSNHVNICVKGGGFKAKTRYALEVNSPQIIHTFKSSVEAEKFTKVLRGNISASCKTGMPENGDGRWLFSDVSIEDLKTKFNMLTKTKIVGSKSYSEGFILINKITKEQSPVFYSVLEPQKQGYKIYQSNLSKCLHGKLKSVGGYFVQKCVGAI